jgi:catechol 2,3-dioxygenase-like lactoylglutathione lyase family enzyme
MQFISAITVLVPTYEEGLDFYVGVLGFELIEDTRLGPQKRWVLVSPYKDAQTRLLLAKAANEVQATAIGNQTGGRVFLFLETDDFERDFQRFASAGVRFLENPRREAYGMVAVFTDPFGNKWDLIESNRAGPRS